jgi:hypothetical protein
MYELRDVNEAAIALETMCSNRHEFECSVPPRANAIFEEVGNERNVGSFYWEILKSQVAPR